MLPIDVGRITLEIFESFSITINSINFTLRAYKSIPKRLYIYNNTYFQYTFTSKHVCIIVHIQLMVVYMKNFVNTNFTSVVNYSIAAW